jgi:peptide-methionine (S)-S-oxide reductase
MSMSRRIRLLAPAAVALVAVVACSPSPPKDKAAEGRTSDAASGDHGVAIFAGGCFWCMETPFDELDGVLSTTSGYTGGTKVNPTYKEVSAGGTGHAEAVQVAYDPSKVAYDELLNVYWRNVDPLDDGGQFCDRGEEYRTAIFVSNEEQRRLAERSKQTLGDSQRFDEPIVTEIVAAETFYPAEDYHQDYAKKNPLRYVLYRLACGRDARLEELWDGEAGGEE